MARDLMFQQEIKETGVAENGERTRLDETTHVLDQIK